MPSKTKKQLEFFKLVHAIKTKKIKASGYAANVAKKMKLATIQDYLKLKK